MEELHVQNINKKNISQAYMSIILICMVLTPFIDNIAGYIINASGADTNFSKIFRLFFLFILLLTLLDGVNRKNFASYFLLLVFIIFLPLFYAILNRTMAGFVTDELYLSKLFLPILFILAMKNLSDRGFAVGAMCLKILKYFAFIYPVSVLLPMLLSGGYKSYGSIGERGFFSSGNEISIVLCAMFIINYIFMREKATVYTVLMTVLSAIIGLLTASKAVLLIYTLFIIFIIFRKQKINSKIKNIVIVCFVFFVLAFIMSQFFSDEIIAFLDKIRFRYRQLDGFWNMLFSNRNTKIIPNFKQNYLSDYGLFYFLLGRGSFYQIVTTKYNSFIAAFGLVEMDFIDLLLQNGIILFFIITRFYYRILKQKVVYEKYSFIRFSYFIMLLFSFMAGHVLYNPLSSTTLALLGSILVIHNEK